MAKPTILFGIILIALAAVAYLGSPDKPAAPATDADSTATVVADAPAAEATGPSKTTLIPALFGIPLLLCGFLGLKESRLKHAMHGAAMVGLLGALGGIGKGAMGLGKFFSGDPALNSRAFFYTWAMAIICAVFVFMCVRSFIAAKKRRLAAEAQA